MHKEEEGDRHDCFAVQAAHAQRAIGESGVLNKSVKCVVPLLQASPCDAC